MAKKIIEEKVTSETTASWEAPVEESLRKYEGDKLTPIDHEYGREDLNELKDKVNELIARG